MLLFYIRGIFEAKQNSDAPAECIRQGVAEASNVVMYHFTQRVDVWQPPGACDGVQGADLTDEMDPHVCCVA